MDTCEVGKIAPGTILYQGRYRIDLVLTRTPHRAIYRAWDLNRNRAASIVEYLPSDDATVSAALERAAPLVQLDHHSLMAFQVVFVEQDTVFAALTFAGGQTIEHIMAERTAPIPPAAAARWISQASEMLEFLASALPAWHLGDLSGGALFVTAEDRAQPLSFEIPLGLLTPAQVAADLPAGAVAPELRQGQCDARSDVYSLAATLHLLLTRQAWSGGDPAADMALETVQPSLPRPLIDVVRRGLSSDPAARWSDVAAFHGALLAAMAAPAPQETASLFPGMPAQPLHEEPATLATPRDALRNAVVAEAAARGEAVPPWLKTPATPASDAAPSETSAAEHAVQADATPSQTPLAGDEEHSSVGAVTPAAESGAQANGPAMPAVSDTETNSRTASEPIDEPAGNAPTGDAAPHTSGESTAEHAAPPPESAGANAAPQQTAAPRYSVPGIVPSIEGSFAIFGRRAAEPVAPAAPQPADAASADALSRSGNAPAQEHQIPDASTQPASSVADAASQSTQAVAHEPAPAEQAPAHAGEPLPGTATPVLPLAAAASGAAIIAAVESGRFSSLRPSVPSQAEPEPAASAEAASAQSQPAGGVAEATTPANNETHAEQQAESTPAAQATVQPNEPEFAYAPDAGLHVAEVAPAIAFPFQNEPADEPKPVASAHEQMPAAGEAESTPQRTELGTAPAGEDIPNALWGTASHDVLDNLAPVPPFAQPAQGLDDVQAMMPGEIPQPAPLQDEDVIPASALTDTMLPPGAPPETTAIATPPAAAGSAETPTAKQSGGAPPWGAITAGGTVGVVGAALWAQHEERARQKEAAAQPGNNAETPTNTGALSQDAAAVSNANAGMPHYDDSDWLNFSAPPRQPNTQPLSAETPSTSPDVAAGSTEAFTPVSPGPQTSEAAPATRRDNGHHALPGYAQATDAEIIASALGGAAALSAAQETPPPEQVITAHPDAPASSSAAAQVQPGSSFAPTHAPTTTPLSKTPSRPLMDRIRQILQPSSPATPSVAIGTVVVPRHMYAQNSYSILVRLQVRAAKKVESASSQQRPIAFVEVEATPADAFYLPVHRLALPIPMEGGLSEGSLSVTAQRPTTGPHDRLTFTFKLSDGTILHKGQFVADVSILGPQQLAAGDPMLTLVHQLDIALP